MFSYVWFRSCAERAWITQTYMNIVMSTVHIHKRVSCFSAFKASFHIYFVCMCGLTSRNLHLSNLFCWCLNLCLFVQETSYYGGTHVCCASYFYRYQTVHGNGQGKSQTIRYAVHFSQMPCVRKKLRRLQICCGGSLFSFFFNLSNKRSWTEIVFLSLFNIS